MPKFGAAKYIAQDLRNNREKRKFDIKVEGDVIYNENELLKTRSMRKKRKQSHGVILSSKLHNNLEEDGEELSITHRLYWDLTNNEDRILTIQPRYCEDEDDTSGGEEGLFKDEKLDEIDGSILSLGSITRSKSAMLEGYHEKYIDKEEIAY